MEPMGSWYLCHTCWGALLCSLARIRLHGFYLELPMGGAHIHGHGQARVAVRPSRRHIQVLAGGTDAVVLGCYLKIRSPSIPAEKQHDSMADALT